MFKVWNPAAMNETFARAFNSRELANLLALYESGAALRTDAGTSTWHGHAQIAAALTRLLSAPGRMVSRNHFCVESGDIALLRADWTLSAEDGTTVASGATAEVVRRQIDGSWLYVIDHAAAFAAAAPQLPTAA